MKTIELDVYQVTELGEEAKKKAVSHYHDINVSFDWWDSDYAAFIADGDAIGISVDADKVFFEGFYSQGSGSTFDADIHLPTLLEHRTSNIDRRVLKLLKNCKIDLLPQIAQSGRGYHVSVDLNTDLPYNRGRRFPNIEVQLEILERWLQDIAEELNEQLYKALEKDYEYQTGEEAIIEAIEANEYWFDASGHPFNHQLK
jgi:hypothetical protein